MVTVAAEQALEEEEEKQALSESKRKREVRKIALHSPRMLQMYDYGYIVSGNYIGISQVRTGIIASERYAI